MRGDIKELISAFPGLSVLVVGDAMLDRYLEGHALRFCREAPVPNVSIRSARDCAGGAGNTAVNVAALGARVEILSIVGDDAHGDALARVLTAQAVGTGRLVRAHGRRTRAKHRVTAAGQLLLSFDEGDDGPADRSAQEALVRELCAPRARWDAIIVADYGYGTLGDRAIGELTALRRRRPFVLAIDSRARLDAFRDAAPDVVKPSFTEACAMFGAAAPADDRAIWIAAHANDLVARTGARLVAATLDREGAVLCAPGRAPQRVFAPPVAAPLAAGAGDTFTAAITLALAAGATLELAGELACHAASIAVAKERTSSCTAAELLGSFLPQGKVVADGASLARLAQAYRTQGRRIVLTNGCFDILHRGHVSLLNEAKTLGDVLIVGVNGDASIRALKGPGRPINGLEDRLQVLCALGCVDHVVAFHEPTADALVRATRPHVFVKGGSYSRATLPEASAVEAEGGIVHILPYLADRSTSSLIERISVTHAIAE